VLERGAGGYTFMRAIPWLIRSFLEKQGTFRWNDHEYYGIGLPEDVLEMIYHGNFERVYAL